MSTDNRPTQTAAPPLSDLPLGVITRRIRFVYTNWRGTVATRTVEPTGLWFGSTEWHPEQQWFLRAVDLEKDAMRDFALRDMKDVTYAE